MKQHGEVHGDARRLLVEKWRTWADTLDPTTSGLFVAGSIHATRMCADELEAALSPKGVLSAPHREMSDAEAVEWLELIDLDGYRTSIKIAMQVAIARLRPAEAVPSAPAGLRAAVQTVLDTFRRDEAQGYSSRDKQFAINILADALSRAEDTP